MTFPGQNNETITATRHLFGYDFEVKNQAGETIATVTKSEADAIHMLEKLNRTVYDAA